MSIEATAWAWRQFLSPMRKMVLLALADHHNGKTGRCDPSVARIVLETGLSLRCVQGHIAGLVELGLSTVRHRRGSSSVYGLQLGVSLVGSIPAARVASAVSRDHVTAPAAEPVTPDSECTVRHPPLASDSDEPRQPLPGNLNLEPELNLRTSLRSEREGALAHAQKVNNFEFWKEAVPTLQRLERLDDRDARQVVGKLPRLMHGDQTAVLKLLHDAEAEHPIAACDWLVAAARYRTREADGFKAAGAQLQAELDTWKEARALGFMEPDGCGLTETVKLAAEWMAARAAQPQLALSGPVS